MNRKLSFKRSRFIQIRRPFNAHVCRKKEKKLNVITNLETVRGVHRSPIKDELLRFLPLLCKLLPIVRPLALHSREKKQTKKKKLRQKTESTKKLMF